MARNKSLSLVIARLEAAREAQGLTHRALSEAAGMGVNYSREVVSVKKSPSLIGVLSLIEALGADPDWILFGKMSSSEGGASERRYKDLGDRLVYLRLAWSGLGPEAWAKRLGFSLDQYQSWEAGETRILVEAAETLHRECGVSLHWIYIGDPALPSDPRPAWETAS